LFVKRAIVCFSLEKQHKHHLTFRFFEVLAAALGFALILTETVLFMIGMDVESAATFISFILSFS
jgi:hypothetical protein